MLIIELGFGQKISAAKIRKYLTYGDELDHEILV